MGDKNTKKSQEKTAVETKFEDLKAKFLANWKIILSIFILLIVLFNIFLGVVDRRISAAIKPEVATFSAFRTDLSRFNTRLVEVEKSSIDVEVVKEDIIAIKQASEEFRTKLAALIRGEEDKLARLEKEVENQKVYLSGLKDLQQGGVK